MSDLRRVTERIEREEFARGHIAPGEHPSTPRQAATIILACEDATSRASRVLLLRRPDTARFAAGAYVFAGGVIDESDASPEAVALLPSALVPQGAAAVAALRELFEETGILVGRAPADAAAARRLRKRLLDGEIGFAEAASGLGADFGAVRAGYLARWITPTRFARRYDTKFFLAVLDAPEPPEPVLTDELDGFLWIEPQEAVRRFAAGELPMLFPTRKTLEALGREADLDRLLQKCRASTPRPVQPRLLVRGASVRPVLPGDPGYEEAD